MPYNRNKTSQILLTCADIFLTSEFVSAQRGRYIITLSPKHKASRLGNTNAAGRRKEKIYFRIHERQAIQSCLMEHIYMVALKNSHIEFVPFACYVHNSHDSPVHNTH